MPELTPDATMPLRPATHLRLLRLIEKRPRIFRRKLARARLARKELEYGVLRAIVCAAGRR